MNMLEAIRATGLEQTVKFYQASTSELYGKVRLSFNAHCRLLFILKHTEST